MEEKRLTVRNTVGAQVPAPRRHLAIEGLEDLTVEEDLILPRWRMVQYSSTIEGEPGQFNNNLTGEIRNSLKLVVLKVTPSRARFDDDRNLVCMSRNGHHSTSGKSCYDCEYAAWGENGEPPACSRGYTLICVDPGDDTLCLVGALKTSVPTIKRYNSLLHHRKRSPFEFLTRFVAEEERGPKHKYFVLDAELLGEHSPEQVAKYREQYLSLASVRIQEVEEPTHDEELDEDFPEEVSPYRYEEPVSEPLL